MVAMPLARMCRCNRARSLPLLMRMPEPLVLIATCGDAIWRACRYAQVALP